ncbi:hypothetical protein GOQ29_06035 [Clostridium sp. D2Q-14]|uniref:hypothetical protein n=1 Tax=Anaeromonas gelatinilytica TaxID=2683194 RepID=UPI00193B2E7C|nr:hypothetical protein [Anaeromonas gelatinilytica]MBS4535179.1 hypothetical protein [Anaeromonas gelatinilytica]
MSNEDKLFELMTKMYGEVQEGFKKTDKSFEEVNERLDKIENRVTIIEQDHGKKLESLFDGYTQLNEKVDRIEDQVSKQEEIIIRKVK